MTFVFFFKFSAPLTTYHDYQNKKKQNNGRFYHFLISINHLCVLLFTMFNVPYNLQNFEKSEFYKLPKWMYIESWQTQSWPVCSNGHWSDHDKLTLPHRNLILFGVIFSEAKWTFNSIMTDLAEQTTLSPRKHLCVKIIGEIDVPSFSKKYTWTSLFKCTHSNTIQCVRDHRNFPCLKLI